MKTVTTKAQLKKAVNDKVQLHRKHKTDLIFTFSRYNDGRDLLEHLNDPWQAVSNIYKLLKPGGALLASLPNVQHISVVMDLLHGFWHYEEAGILDRTHLRFFTRNSVAEMIVQAGFKDVKIVSKQIPLATEQEEYLRLLQTQPGVGTDEDNLRTYQWLVVARR